MGGRRAKENPPGGGFSFSRKAMNEALNPGRRCATPGMTF
jgi:hypothetical protein